MVKIKKMELLNFVLRTRSIPFLLVLQQTPSGNRRRMLRAFPNFVIDDLVEVLYNMVIGKVKINKNRMNKLRKFRTSLLKMVHTKSQKGKRNVILEQKGGFINALIPVVASLIPLIAKRYIR